jgi:hypothetical protein
MDVQLDNKKQSLFLFMFVKDPYKLYYKFKLLKLKVKLA